VLCGDQVDKARIAQAEKAGVKVITVPLDDEGMSRPNVMSGRADEIGRVAPDTIPGVLTRMGLKSVMIEGGSQVLSSFLRSPPRQDGSPMVDSVIVTVGPMLIGEGVGVVPKVSYSDADKSLIKSGRRSCAARSTDNTHRNHGQGSSHGLYRSSQGQGRKDKKEVDITQENGQKDIG
jgi:riboflavin biosynthesis pyrimidine reductase